MVIRDFDFVGMAPLPAETDSVLIIDTNTMLTAPTSLQTLQSIARRHRKFTKVSDPVYLRQFAPDNGPKNGGTRGSSSAAIDTIEDIFGSRVREGAYHGIYYNGYRAK